MLVVKGSGFPGYKFHYVKWTTTFPYSTPARFRHAYHLKFKRWVAIKDLNSELGSKMFKCHL